MQIQAIFLSLVILLSLFASRDFGIEANRVEEAKPSFTRDLYLTLSKKTTSLEETVVVLSGSAEEKIKGAVQGISSFHESFIREVALNSLNKEGIYEPKRIQGIAAEANIASISEGATAPLMPKINNYCGPIDYSSLSGEADLIKYLNYSITILERNPEKRWPIASLTKLMTAAVAFEKINLDAAITIGEKAIAADGTIGDFKEGEIFRARDLIEAMLVGSSNDAAVALVESIGEKEFIDHMQKKANELGMLDTTYIEPTGLSFVNQSTISDLTKLIGYVYEKHPELLEISREKQIEITELKSGKKRGVVNINKFAGEPDFIGGKTGFIDEAGRNLIAIFKIKDELILTIVLGSDNAFEETARLKEFAARCESTKYNLGPSPKNT